MDNRTDADLMKFIRSGDTRGFDALVMRYTPLLMGHLTSIVHDADAAQDVFQETFLRVWTRAEQWSEERGTVKAWLFRIGTNLALNSLRSASRRREISLQSKAELPENDGSYVDSWMIDSENSPEAAFEHAERAAAVKRLVDSLSEEKRELIRLVYDSDMPIKEAAQALGIPEGTAKSRLHYSVRIIAREWRNLEDE